MAQWPFGYTTETTILDEDFIGFGKTTILSGKNQRKALTSVWRTFFQGTAVPANTAYKDRVKTKVLWTGPLSVVSTPTSLNGGEAFSDWDIIEVHIALISDTDITKVVPLSMSNVAFNQIDAFDNTGRLRFRKITDTTFEIAQKTVSLGNISRIIGISL